LLAFSCFLSARRSRFRLSDGSPPTFSLIGEESTGVVVDAVFASSPLLTLLLLSPVFRFPASGPCLSLFFPNYVQGPSSSGPLLLSGRSPRLLSFLPDHDSFPLARAPRVPRSFSFLVSFLPLSWTDSSVCPLPMFGGRSPCTLECRTPPF